MPCAEFIETLAAEHRNVTVVGDDAQSIYSWRGANFKNILAFPERYPDAQVLRFELNYRSVPEILSVANAAVAPNGEQFKSGYSNVILAGQNELTSANLGTRLEPPSPLENRYLI